MAERVRELPIALWAVFFLIATGRGAALDQIDAEECERVLQVLDDLGANGTVRDQDYRGTSLPTGCGAAASLMLRLQS